VLGAEQISYFSRKTSIFVQSCSVNGHRKLNKNRKNADVCAPLRQARHLPQVAQEWAKTSMFVPRCPKCAHTPWDKNGRKRSLSFQTVSGTDTLGETNIAVFKEYERPSIFGIQV
jgi:hypothetical protein